MSGQGFDELAFAGPAALAEKVRVREVSARELVELYLRRIEALDPRVNAFRIVLAEEALARADSLAGFDGPLAGVPIAVKDDLAVAGQPVTRGSRSYGPPASEDAEPVRRLRAAGAIPVGVTKVPELMIFPWTASDAGGVTRNPWDLSRTPGGSSGGSAAALAAGMVPAATGSDGGGSIRIPAACCGLVGMKPTRGRVSHRPAPVAGWLGLSEYGPLARTVLDSALLLDVMHGVLPGDEYSAPRLRVSCVEATRRAPGRLRVAASRKLPPGAMARLSRDQLRAWEGTRELLVDLGHEVVEQGPAYGLAALEFTRTWTRGVYEESLTVPDRSRLERSTRQMAAAGRYLVPARRRSALLERRARVSARILALWNDVDVLLTPGLATTAIAAEGGYGRPAPVAFNVAARFTPWTPPFNLTGQPAVALPAGYGSDGLPLSVQLVGRPGAEDVLYSLSAQLEQARPWASRVPPLATTTIGGTSA
ncbi:MAG: amidase [Solirubrobacterales bacterium]|nr:amidase [Solirubrobacterales bacterium]MBV9714675.1 amidase [Solirubrobacterales bacterium]